MWFVVYLVLLNDPVWELREFAQEGITELVKEDPYAYGPKILKIFNETESPETRFRLRIPLNVFVKRINEYRPETPVWPSYDQIDLIPFDSLGSISFSIVNKKKYDEIPEKNIAKINGNGVYYPDEPHNCHQRVLGRDWIRGLLANGTLTEKQATNLLNFSWNREMQYYGPMEREMKEWKWHDGITTIKRSYYYGR